jgi:ketosteroid isomerase-like protein
MRFFSIAISFVVVAMPASAQTPAEVVAAFHDAIARSDTSATLAYLDPAVVIFESGGAEMSRDEFASHHMGADMAYAGATNRETTQSQTTVAGDVAVVMNRTKTTGSYKDRDINSTGAETAVLRKTDDAWRIVHIHWSSRRQR